MDRGSTTRLEIGEIAARCPGCSETAFRPQVDGEASLVCAACGIATPRHTLIDQIAREAIRRAEDLLRTIRQRP